MKLSALSHILFFAAPLAVCLSSCGEDDPDVIPVPPADSAPRTVLVYMVANNSLGNTTTTHPGFDNLDIAEMKEAANAGDLGDSRLLVYHHSKQEDEPSLLEIKKDEVVTLKTYPAERNASVTIGRMQQVFEDMRSFAKADNYGLVLWSHATGWLQDGIADNNSPKRSFGEDGGRTMNITSLATALESQNFDYVYFDCCYMASVEVVYQLRKVTPTIVVSAAELPAKGMPYNKTLKYLVAKEADVVAAAKTFFKEYEDSYDPKQIHGCTVSVVSNKWIGALASATLDIYSSHPTLPDEAKVQQFENYDCYYYDFKDYITSLEGVDRNMIDAWDAALQKTVLYQAATKSVNMVNKYDVDAHCGLTTYILRSPQDAYTKNYNALDWYADVASALISE